MLTFLSSRSLLQSFGLASLSLVCLLLFFGLFSELAEVFSRTLRRWVAGRYQKRGQHVAPRMPIRVAEMIVKRIFNGILLRFKHRKESR